MTTAKTLQKEMLDSFIGGQVRTVSQRGVARRGEIASIIYQPSGRAVSVNLLWCATETKKGFISHNDRTRTIDLPTAQWKEEPDGVVVIDIPYGDLQMYFYPQGHRTNIRREDVQEPE